MPVGGERPDPPKGQSGISGAKAKAKDPLEKESKGFFAENWEILAIFTAVILGSNFHKIFPTLGEGKEWFIYLFGQQLLGASVLYTFVYWVKMPRKFAFKKSLALGILVLSVLSAVGEGLTVYGSAVLNQANKGGLLVAEYSFIAGICALGYVIYRKYDKKNI